jgi:Protein of unknown function (DUF998)
MRNSTLLTSGMIAGPLFIIVSLILAFTREGFDLVRHPASLLALGHLGWIQIANFVVSGALFIALAIGLRRVLTSGVGSRWLPILFGLVGVAMIIGGVFVPDPALGFPPGAPAGVPNEMSWHSMVHGFAPILGFLALIAALMWASIVVGVATLVLTWLPNLTADWKTGRFNFLPLWAGVALGYCYASLVIAMLRKNLDSRRQFVPFLPRRCNAGL